MDPSSDKVEALFQAAVALETEAQRAEYLNRACPDPELRREVESLLAAHDHPDPLLATRPEPTRPTIKLDLPEAQFDVADVARHFPQLEILELLGQGGMGVVFKARQPQLDRLVALKIMLPEFGKDPRFAERFTREARALAKLNHPNIVAVYEFGQAGGGPAAPASASSEPGSANPAAGGFFYFLMEYVDGANLRAMLRGGRLTPEQAFAIVPRICDALQFAHDEGIMHRDIKPENILIDKRGRVKIADFGLAKLLGRETAGESITVTGLGMGTPRYMAPEQIENAKAVDHRADIYSLGVVFYEMLTGELPLGRFAPPSQKVQVDVRLDEVVLHALEKEPGRRYQHASEVKTAVEQISTTTPAAVPPLVPVVPPAAAPVEDAATDAASHVRGPAFAVMANGFLYVIAAALFAVAGLLDPIQTGLLRGRWSALQDQNILQLAAVLPLLVLGILALLGGWKMMHLCCRGLSVFASTITLPVGFWGLSVLSNPVVREAFRAAANERREQTGQGEPVISRKAIWAVIWACGVPLAVLAWVYPLRPTWDPESAGALWRLILGWGGCLVGAGAAIGAPLLGILAMHEIRYSRGRIVGLPLAFGCGIAFPLLLLAFVLAYSLGHMFAGMDIGLGSETKAMLTLFVPLIVGYFIIVAAWRKVSPPVLAAGPGQATPRRWMSPAGGQIPLCLIGVGVSLWPILPRSDPFWGFNHDYEYGQPQGLKVTQIAPASPAQRAGLVVGDIITAVDDHPLKPSELAAEIARVPTLGQVRLAVDRGGQKLIFSGVAEQPQVEWIIYWNWQFLSAAIFALLAIFLFVTRSVSVGLWRPIVVAAIAIIGTACLLAIVGDLYVGGRLGSTVVWRWYLWSVPGKHIVPPHFQAILCLIVTIGLLFPAAIEMRDILSRKSTPLTSEPAPPTLSKQPK